MSRTPFIAGILLAVSLLAFMAVWTYWESSEQADAVHWVEHTYAVIDDLHQVAGGITAAEAAVGSCVLSGDARLLADLPRELAAMDAARQRIRQLTADNSAQQRRLDALDAPLRERVLLLTAAASTGRPCSSATLPETLQRPSTKIRGALEEMIGVERELLRRRAETRAMEALRVRRLTLAGHVASIALVLVLCSLLLLEMNRRNRADQVLAETLQRGAGRALPDGIGGGRARAAAGGRTGSPG